MTNSAWALEDAAHFSASQPHHQPRYQRPAITQPRQQQHQPPQPQQQYHHHTQQHRQQYRNPHAHCSNDGGRFPCVSLGVNRTTGRLQWCPTCKYVKIMLLLPAALAPVVLLLLLLGSQLQAVDHNGPSAHLRTASAGLLSDSMDNAIDVFDDVDRIDVANDPLLVDKSSDRSSRCTAIRYPLSETGDIEERELLLDVRTSFIPPDYVYTSPDCVMASRTTTSTLTGNDEADAEDDGAHYEYAEAADLYRDIADDMAEVLEPNAGEKRQRRETMTNVTAIVEMLKSVVLGESGGETFLAAGPLEGSAEQIRAAQSAMMQQYMDPTVDPCTNFYQYACGNWERLNKIPKDKGAFDTFEMLREKLDSILRELLSEPVTNIERADDINNGGHISTAAPDSEHSAADPEAETDENKVKLRRRLRRRIVRRRAERLNDDNDDVRVPTEPLQAKRHEREMDAEDKAKLLFQTCMNYESLEERGIQPLLDFLKTIGGWPALDDDWQADRFDWLNLTATLRRYNNDILLMLWVGADIKNSNENIIQFDQTTLGLPTRGYFLESSNARYLDAYTEYMQTIIEILGADRRRAKAEAANIVRFETDLARITSKPEARVNVSLLYNKLQLDELQMQIPQIDWRRYLSLVQERHVLGNESVVMYAMDYMKSLVSLLETSDSRTVANYVVWRFVRHRINNVDDRFQAAKQRFFYVLFGREESPERWKTCVSHVNTNMGMAVGAMFVRRYFDENSKRDTLEMTHELQQAFREILNTTEWLDPPTRHFAELKVNAMQLRIGYPDFILQKDQLNAKFAGLKVDADRYFENSLHLLLHMARSEQARLGEPINRTEWSTAPAIINAYYSRNKNQILFPAGILQPPFYHRHFPRALNYGGIGVVIGHELTHGFDDKGRLFDMDGNMLRWWSFAAVEGFHKRASCLVEQYGNYTVPDVPGVMVNGETTQGENIADNGGLIQAYRAYTQWLETHPDAAQSDEQMPGMELSGRQLFFLNFAQVWCGAMRPEAARNKMKTAVHSPGMYRVIGTLTNSVEFSQVYGCAAGTPMNPVHKCRVW